MPPEMPAVRLSAVAEVVPGFEEGDLAPHPIYLAAALGGEVLGSCVEVRSRCD